MMTRKRNSWYDSNNKALTVGERFTRVVHAIMQGDENLAYLETRWLVRASRHTELLKDRAVRKSVSE